jgi:hypothetical protein
MLPIDFQAAKPKRAAPSQHEVGAVFAGRPARWNGTACCGDSERAPQFPWSQSSESHAQNTTPHVIRQATDVFQCPGHKNAWVYGFTEQFSTGEQARCRFSLPTQLGNEHWRFCATGESLLAQCASVDTKQAVKGLGLTVMQDYSQEPSRRMRTRSRQRASGNSEEAEEESCQCSAKQRPDHRDRCVAPIRASFSSDR